MKELIECIAKSLVEHPDQVRIREREEEGRIVFVLSVAPEDMGKVIGKQGRIAKALRTVVGAAAVREDKRVMVEIV
ncbi:KH domain-containing protein [Salinithrix halophila]|uniref:RNA-binding protein KhpA n=1 Tax=Salinithrix halophila TaxID=1485204 RepID=A0ABV8JBX6_9BACL